MVSIDLCLPGGVYDTYISLMALWELSGDSSLSSLLGVSSGLSLFKPI